MGQVKTVHAGHGGAKVNGRWTDSGAVGSGRQEADVARTITTKMAKALGAKDITDNTSRTSNAIIYEQARRINANADGIHISNHLNSAGSTATGVEVLYGSVAQKALAEQISASIARDLGIPNRGAKDGSWLGIASMTGAGKKVLLIEWCFINNQSDVNKLMANMDKAISNVSKILGGQAVTPSQPSQPSKPSTDGISDTRNFPKGSKVKVRNSASAYYTGQPIASFVKGQTYKVKDSKVVNKSRSKYAFLLEGINSWVLAQDLDAVAGQQAAAQSPNTNYPENGSAKMRCAMTVRTAPRRSASATGTLPAGYVIRYNHVFIEDNHVWVRYQANSGTRYVAVKRVSDGYRFADCY